MTPEQTTSYYENSPFAQKMVVAILCVGFFLGPLMLASVHVALPSIAIEFEASARLMSWVPTAFVITNAVCLLPLGKCADRVGRKKIYQLGLIILLVGSLLAAVSMNMTHLLISRVVQGFGSAMIYGTGMAIVTSVVSKNYRGTALGLISGCVFVSLTVSPFIGGILTEAFNWRAVFIVPIPIGLIAFTIGWFFLKGEWKQETKSLFDFKGTLIFSLVALTLIYGLSHLPEVDGLISIVISAILIMVFIHHQSKIDYGILNIQLLKTNYTFSFALLSSFFMYASNFGVNFLLSLYLQYIGALSPKDAGAMLIYQAMMMAISSVIAGRVADRFNNSYVSAFGCTVTTIGYSWLAFSLSFDTPLGHIIIGQILVGFGFGFFSTPNNSAALGSVNTQTLGSASAMLNFIRNAGNLTGMGVVMLLISIYLGGAQISQDNYEALLNAIKFTLFITVCYSILGGVFSVARVKSEKKRTKVSLP